MSLNQYAQSLLNYRIWTNAYGVARTALALGLLLTLVFNNTDTLFRPGLLNDVSITKATITQISLYKLVSLETARWISVAVLLFVISGYFPRYTGILHWWVAFSFNASGVVVDGGDQINAIATLLLIPITLADKRRNHWQIEQEYSSSSFLRINAVCAYFFLRLQMSVLYFHAAVGKFKVTEWLDGTALYYWFSDPSIGMPPWLFDLMYYPLTNAYFITILTWGVMIFEVSLAFALVMNLKMRRRFLWPAIFFHFMIIVSHGLVSFFFGMLGGLIIYLYPLQEPMRFPRWAWPFSAKASEQPRDAEGSVGDGIPASA